MVDLFIISSHSFITSHISPEYVYIFAHLRYISVHFPTYVFIVIIGNISRQRCTKQWISKSAMLHEVENVLLSRKHVSWLYKMKTLLYSFQWLKLPRHISFTVFYILMDVLLEPVGYVWILLGLWEIALFWAFLIHFKQFGRFSFRC